MSEPIDTTRAPRGELAATNLVNAVAGGDDRVERHYLEVKGLVDLSKKADLAKIAKFILGAANRQPDIAATAFEGFAVMVLGVSPGCAHGVPPIEILDIARVVQPFLGAAGPRWDLVRIPVSDSENEVLVVLVDPPAVGQGPFACRQNGEYMTDGRVYIRADGETREAKADELDQLILRGQVGIPSEVGFEVRVVGEAIPVEDDWETTLEQYVAWHKNRLLSALPTEQSVDEPGMTTVEARSPSYLNQIAASAAFLASASGAEPEKRSRSGYIAEIDRWEDRLRAAWPESLDGLAGYALPGVVVRIGNSTKTFFHDVELKIHLEGDVRGLPFIDRGTKMRRSDLDLPEPPITWGPTRRGFSFPNLIANNFTPGIPSMYQSPLSWRNSGSIDLVFAIGDLRPRETHMSDDDEMILVVPRSSETQVRGTWEVTARGHNDIYTGDLLVNIGDSVSLTPLLRELLGLDRVASNE